MKDTDHLIRHPHVPFGDRASAPVGRGCAGHDACRCPPPGYMGTRETDALTGYPDSVWESIGVLIRRTCSHGFNVDGWECAEILVSQSTMGHGEEKGARIGKEFTIRTRFQEGHVFLRRGKRRKVWAARWGEDVITPDLPPVFGPVIS